MVGRTGFVGDLLYSFGVSGFIYPILGHWAWGPDGWLNTIKPAAFHDFAGSTVVHTIGGFVALAGAIALGPRLGRKFKRDGGGMPPGHDMTIAAVGGVILWFGWYGFNPGSTLSAMDAAGCGRVAANTTLAACAGGLSALAYVYPRNKVWDCGMTVNGFLAGLVAITCPCYWVSPFGAIMIGAIAGVVVVLGVDLMEYLRIDDPGRRGAGARRLRHLGHAEPRVSSRPASTALPTPTGADNSAACGRHGPLLRRRRRPADRDKRSAAQRSPRPRSASAWRSCTRSRRPAPSASRRTASSKGSTCTSTAGRLTPSW